MIANAPVRSVHATDVDGDGDVDVLSASEGDNKIAWYENIDGKGRFGEQRAITTFLQTAKYLTGQPATFEEGDWNNDGVFDQLDIVAASQTGNYLRGPYAAESYN